MYKEQYSFSLSLSVKSSVFQFVLNPPSKTGSPLFLPLDKQAEEKSWGLHEVLQLKQLFRGQKIKGFSPQKNNSFLCG